MKKIALTLIAAIAIAIGANAREMEVSVSYGGFTLMDATDYHDGWTGVDNSWGALNMGFNVKLMPKLWVGPSYTFSSTSTGGIDNSHIYYHVIMVNGRYEYYRNRLLTVYARMGVGTVVSHFSPIDGRSFNKCYFAFQLSPAGVDVDINRSLTMFGEAGFGVQGMLQVGLRVNF